MKIGQLNTDGSGVRWALSFYRGGGKQPLLPDVADNGVYTWKWEKVLCTDVEFHYAFSSPIFVSLVRLELPSEAAVKAELHVPTDCGTRCVGVCKAENGKTLGGTVEIGTAYKTDQLIVRITPTMQDLSLAEPAVFGSTTDTQPLYPTPKAFKQTDGRLPIEALFCTEDDAHPDCAFAAQHLKARAEEQWGLHTAGNAHVVFRCAPEMRPDSYRLTVTPERACVEASNRLGLLYAAERIMELSDENGVLCGELYDEPYKTMRGFHMGLPAKEEIPFFKRLVRTILLPFHYNHIILEFAGGMRFDSHPEISEAWLRGNEKAAAGEIPPFPHGAWNAGGTLLEKEDVRDLCAYARAFGFEMIPEVQSFGHVQYITYAHPDIAEVDENESERKLDTRAADQPPSLFYDHCYCPQNEKSYRIIFDLIDEIVDVVQPERFVHMGHDEIYRIGVCPRCKHVPHDQLYEKHVKAMHAHLAQKGLRMMIWADMLQPTETKYATSAAISRLPKDIVLLDFIWYFHFELDMEDNLLPHGFEVMMGNLYSSHYTRYERRAAKANMIGGEVSTWCRVCEYDLAKLGKLYDLMYTGEQLWSSTYRSECRTVYADIIASRIPQLRDRLRGYKTEKRVWQTLQLPETSFDVPHGLHLLGTPRLLTKPLQISVYRCAAALQFIHTTLREERRVAWEPLTQVGTYTICYADGTTETVAMEYDGNIRQYCHRFGEPHAEKYYRHQGYAATWFGDPYQVMDECGENVTALSFEWLNPHPQKEIVQIIAEEAADSAAGVVLCGVAVR